MRSERKRYLAAFLIELLVYGALVTGYFFLVLHFLAHHLPALHERSKAWYAVVSLALILVQGAVLEIVTTSLVRFIRARIR